MLGFKVYHREIIITTKRRYEFYNITESVKEWIKYNTGIQNGILSISASNTTTALIINEDEPLLLRDFRRILRILSVLFRVLGIFSYRHDDLGQRRKLNPKLPKDELKNAAAHCLAIQLSTSQSLGIENRDLCLGKWQNIFLVELDKPRERTVYLTAIGHWHNEMKL